MQPTPETVMDDDSASSIQFGQLASQEVRGLVGCNLSQLFASSDLSLVHVQLALRQGVNSGVVSPSGLPF